MRIWSTAKQLQFWETGTYLSLPELRFLQLKGRGMKQLRVEFDSNLPQQLPNKVDVKKSTCWDDWF
jgi:hypothetical protein